MNMIDRNEELKEAQGLFESFFRPLRRLSPRQREVTLLEVASSVNGERKRGRFTAIAKMSGITRTMVSQYANAAHTRLKSYFIATGKSR